MEGGVYYIHTSPELMEVQRLSLYIRRPQNPAEPSAISGIAGGRADYTSKPAAARNWACSATMGEAEHRYNNGGQRFAGMLPPMSFVVDDIGSWKAFLYLQDCPSAAR